MIEVIKQLVEALEWCHGGEPVGTAEAIKAGKQAIAELEKHKCTYPDCPYPCLDLPDCIDAKKQEADELTVAYFSGFYDGKKSRPKPEDYQILEQSLTRLQKRYGELEAKLKINPLTVEQLREHWQVAKVLDMTDAEIDFADYVLIARDIEALYGIKGEA